jgi:hypothetical protein
MINSKEVYMDRQLKQWHAGDFRDTPPWKCSEPGCFGPTIAHDDSSLCMGHKIASGVSQYEAKMGSVNKWREELEVTPSMSKEEVLNKFREWRESKKTCQRCEEKNLSVFCPVRLICEEADRKEPEKDGREIVIGEGCNGDFGIEEIGLSSHESKRLELGTGL